MKIKVLIIFALFLASTLSAINGYAIVTPGNSLTSVYVEGPLPITDPDSTLWKKAIALQIPLSGQTVVAPMRLEPFTKSIQVKSLNNGSWIAFLITWSDPTKNDRTVKIDEFRDSVAIQFAGSVLVFICMGVRDQLRDNK